MSTSRRSALRRVALIAIAAGAACESPTSEAPVSDILVLVSVAGAPLPTLTNIGGMVEILADTFRLRTDGSGDEVSVARVVGTADRVVTRGGFTWTNVGGRLEVSFACNDTPLASCVAPPHLAGPLTATAWTLDRAAWYQVPSILARVGGSD